jgi:glycine cleavage system H protein
MNIPNDLKYNASHEWLRLEGDIATVGITEHAQSELSDVVFVELPEPGKALATGDPAAVVESVKAASDIYAPVAGEIIEGNTALEEDPALVNSSPYGDGWLFKMKVADQAEVEKLLDAVGYGKIIG